ncbi:hypothetical protein G6M26_06380 [Agrobacterium tumefaciens]|nr:hypothetical protein [Agrobacterium tumefaciens]NTE18144.1 hypothetical protein [Agrobacterium tumefaciens]
MQKISLFSIIFITLYFSLPVKGQFSDEEKRLATINIPTVPSPNAASLGQYANYPVNNFTGSPSINVPLYELIVGDFKLPISLSYNSTGIKVGDVASWVGLGWSLNCGGVITRNVMDVADDKNHANYGWLHYNYIVDPNSWDNGNRTLGYSPQGGQKNVIGLSEMRKQGVVIDTEPDLFYFNFNGRVGKFVFSQGRDTLSHIGQISPNDHTINLIPYQDLKFNYSLVNDDLPYNTSTIGAFNVVDENGNRYYFEKAEWTYGRVAASDFIPPSLISNYYSGGYEGTQSQKSSWYLTRIITANYKLITFNYEEENFSQDLPETYSVRNFPTQVNYVSTIDCSVAYDFYNTSYRRTTNRTKGQRLVSIESSDLKIVFDSQHSRQDLIGASALTGITIFSKNENGNLSFVKKINLDYSYMQSSIDPILDQTANNKNTTTFGDPNKRLCLDHVFDSDELGKSLNPYVFEYDSKNMLPSRFSPHQDFWGYFNNNTCNTLTPTVYIYPGEIGSERFSVFRKTDYGGTDEFILSGADRNANPEASMAGTLKKISYPLGGYEEFTFGANEFFLYGRNIKGGGLRLEKTVRYDGVSHLNDIIKEYSYHKNSENLKSNGVLFNLPVFAYTENFLPYWNPSNPSQVYPRPGGEFDPETFGYFLKNMVVTSAPNYTLSGYDGVNIGYSEITERNAGIGYTVKHYSTPGDALAVNDKLNEGCNISENGYCDGLFRTSPVEVYFFLENCPDGSPELGDQMIDQTGLQLNSNGYPFAPKTNYEWNRGLLLSEKMYGQDSRLLKETNMDYEIYTPHKKNPQYVYGLRKARMSNYKPYTSTCWGPTYGLYRFDVVVYYPVITNVAKVLKEMTIKEYSNNEITTITKSNLYNGNQLNPSSIFATNSRGERLIEEFKYVNDFSQVSPVDPISNGIINLRTRNIIKPLEVSSYIADGDGTNKRLKSSLLYLYNPNMSVVDSIMVTEASETLLNFQQASIENVFTKDSHYRTRSIADRYDPQNNNLLESHALGAPKQCLIWSYNRRYIIAEIKNTEYSILENILGGPTVISDFSSSIPTDEQVAAFVRLLRNSTSLKNAQITSYTYKPLVGITSMTDPKGMTTYYEYDNFGRLKWLKDQHGNILKENTYHYKN